MQNIHPKTTAERLHVLTAAGVAAGFLLLTAGIGVRTVSENSALLHPEGISLSARMDDFQKKVTEVFTEKTAGFDRFLSLYGVTQRLLGTSVYEDAGVSFLIRDRENFFHFDTHVQDPAPYADAVAALSDTLRQADIPFLYLQAPSKEIDGFTVYPPGIRYASADNARAMGAALQMRGVDFFSFGDFFADGPYDPASLFYRTDHHWTTETAFEAFSVTLPYLAETYHLPLDVSVCDRENWVSESFPQSFSGSIGRRLGKELTGLDDYTYLEPAFASDYQVFFPPESTEKPYWTGSFRDTLVRESLLYADDVSANRYASYFQYDYGELRIENLTAGNDLHVAIIKDSFALPFTAFLSTAVSRIDMVDLREFPGSVTEYLLERQPDLVLMLYSNSSFQDIMYRFDG